MGYDDQGLRGRRDRHGGQGVPHDRGTGRHASPSRNSPAQTVKLAADEQKIAAQLFRSGGTIALERKNHVRDRRGQERAQERRSRWPTRRPTSSPTARPSSSA
ncbi:MAG: hypothetical protein MZU95_04720 [Desulfomicrobium escambiense]|nr:hypothetical protein [Desulfomicrobium escambiense]